MKTGKVAKLFQVDPGTILNWVRTPELEHFFSDAARGADGRAQRDFNESDVLILTTIYHQRQLNHTWHDIANLLESGHRDSDLPEGAALVETGLAPLQQYGKLVSTAAERDRALALISDLQSQLAAKDDLIESLREENSQQREALLREMSDLRADLMLQIGILKGRLAQFEAHSESSFNP